MHTRLTIRFIDAFKGFAVPVAIFIGFGIGMAVGFLV